MNKAFLLFIISILCFEVAAAEKIFNVNDFGAKGDGVTLDTKAINDAVMQCSKNGGGIVLFNRGGVYLTGSIHILGNIEYRIESGAKILGARSGIGAYDKAEDNKWSQYQDFGHTHYHNSLLWGDDVENVIFSGGGEINGGGIIRSQTTDGDANKAIAIKNGRNIRFENISVVQGGWFAFILNNCRGVVFNNVHIDTVRDGIDLMSCSDVLIEQCNISSVRKQDGKSVGGDDAIGIKSDYSLGRTVHSRNIIVRDCIIASGCNAIQFGSETAGDFSDIVVENCVIRAADKAGIGITSNDGAVISNVVFRNIAMTKVSTPLFIYVSDRLRTPDRKNIGKIENILIENVTAYDCLGYGKEQKFTSTISGMSSSMIENVTLRNFSVIYKGAMKEVPLKIAPNTPKGYAPRELGVRPASGLFIRNAKNIKLEQVVFSFEEPDYRPAFVVDNVDSVTLTNCSALSAAQSDVVLIGVKGDSINNNLKVKRQ